MSELGTPATNGRVSHDTPFLEIDRGDWAALAPTVRAPLTETEIAELTGLGEPLDLIEIEQVYLPLSRLLALYAESSQYLHDATNEFLGSSVQRTPFVIGVAGSVAVGKSTVSRVLKELLSRWEDTPRVELVTTDGFLLPNAELERRGLLDRKGFPESYDRRALLRFVSEVKSGKSPVTAPVYSHLVYDIVPEQVVTIERPDVLIIEGLNVLQPPAQGAKLAVSDLFDFTIYVDARTSDIERWYGERFMSLQRGAFGHPDSYLHRYASLTEPEARALALDIWSRINLTNLEQNILPTRARADLVLRKAADHTVETVLLRKV